MNTITVTHIIERYQLSKSNRKRELVYMRYILYTYLRKNKLSLARIGAMFNKDHTSVLHGLRQYEICKSFSDFVDLKEMLEQELMQAEQEIPQQKLIELTDIEIDLLQANSIFDFWNVKNNLIKKLSIKE